MRSSTEESLLGNLVTNLDEHGPRAKLTIEEIDDDGPLGDVFPGSCCCVATCCCCCGVVDPLA